MTTLDRRTLLQSAAGAVATLSAASYARAAGANDRIRVGVVGIGGMGRHHVNCWKAVPGADLAYLCDVDSQRLTDAAKRSKSARPVDDLRRILDDRSIDVISIATPDHWHAPAALLALEAGKHVYVEKPCAHNFREAQALADAAREHKLHVQHGTQARSIPFIRQAMALLHKGIIGDVLVSKAWNVQRRADIGRAKPTDPPSGVDYDTWLGPAPEVPFQANRFHSVWRWWYDFGVGDIGNDGVHELDLALWGLGVDALPTRIASLGGKYFFDDDREFPDTQSAVFEFPVDGQPGRSRQLIYEMRLWTAVSPFNVDNGCEFYGTKGTMMLGKRGKLQVLDERKQRVPAERLPTPVDVHRAAVVDHMGNLVDAIREGKPLHGDVKVGYRSAALAHLGNLSARVGRTINFDPATLQIVDDDEANQLLGRKYRQSHWATPKSLV